MIPPGKARVNTLARLVVCECVHAHLCIKYGDGQSQARAGELGAWEARGSSSALVSSILESESEWERDLSAGPTETVLLRLLLLAQPGQKLWAQGRHLLGEMCPLALQCPCLDSSKSQMPVGWGRGYGMGEGSWRTASQLGPASHFITFIC